MLISTKGRYALRVMVEMAQRQEEGYISLKSVAQHQGISEKYMEAIMKNLVAAGLTVGLRGKGGGYKLAKPPQQCSAAAILRAAGCLQHPPALEGAGAGGGRLPGELRPGKTHPVPPALRDFGGERNFRGRQRPVFVKNDG